MNLKTIAIYLPQFHPIPENDKWWGKGFTEWTNVTKAKPLFKGHYQPHLPADLGFYDLRLHEARLAQEQLAKEYGIYGFCYYHYWFNGKRMLNEPLDRKLQNQDEDLPFMICWANENWTRVWDGGDKDILLEQKYSHDDDVKHINHLLPYLKDKRYIKVNGKPIIAIYKSTIIPNIKSTVETWRSIAKQNGLELYICRFEHFGEEGKKYIEEGNFDAAIEFQPFTKSFYELKNIVAKRNLYERLKLKLAKLFLSEIKFSNYYSLRFNTLNYLDYIKYYLQHNKKSYQYFPGITPSWDNSSRKKNNYFLFKEASPKYYQYWLSEIISNFKPTSSEENFIFINAWNEWAEGNHLEPCQKWGLQYLQSTKEVLEKHS